MSALLLCALNLAFIAALPRIFFRPGTLNRAWWLTALPFGVASVALVAAVLRPGMLAVVAPVSLQLAGVLFAAASIALIAFTLGSHREPVSLWHQPDDEPRRIVMHGAYARVRHPFYAAFQLALLACLCAAPGALTAAALAWAVVQLRRTASREERRLLASPHGEEYARYMQATGRFLPRWRGGAGLARALRPPSGGGVPGNP